MYDRTQKRLTFRRNLGMIKVIKIAQSETVYGLFQNVGEPERMVYHEVFEQGAHHYRLHHRCRCRCYRRFCRAELFQGKERKCRAGSVS